MKYPHKVRGSENTRKVTALVMFLGRLPKFYGHFSKVGAFDKLGILKNKICEFWIAKKPNVHVLLHTSIVQAARVYRPPCWLYTYYYYVARINNLRFARLAG